MEHLTMRIWPAALSLLLLLVPVSATALGLGQIEVNSALNEPLQARIDLRALQEGDLEGMQVRLGTSEQFQRAGIPRPFVLSKLKFEAVDAGGSASYIQVRTAEPVVEPFLNFLVEVTWPRGRIVREYTILLDPPVYGAAISAKAKKDLASVRVTETPQPVAPAPLPAPRPTPRPAPEPMTAAPAPAVPVTPAPARAPEPAAPAPEPMAAAPAPEPAVVPQPAPSPAGMPRAAIPGTYEVVRGDTLWSLATRYRPDSSVSIQRMMLALLSANPDAFFLDGNINALRAGAILKIPDLAGVAPMDRATVLAEVTRHNALWEEYKANLAGRITTAPEGTVMAAAPATPETMTAAAAPEAPRTEGAQPTAEPATVAPSAAVEDPSRLELVAAGQATEGAGTGAGADAEALRRQLNLAQEEADAKRRQAEELDSRVQELEGIVQDLQRAIQLRDDNIAALQEMLNKAEQEAESLRQAAEQAAQPDSGAIAPPGVPAPVAPEPAMPEPPAPEVTAPEPPAPEVAAPEPAMPEPPAPEAAAPEPAAPEAPTPEVAAPEPVTPEPAQPQPPAAPPPPPEPAQAAAPPPPPPPPAPAPSFLDSLLESLPVDPVLLGAGLGGLLVVLGGAALWRRRRSAEEVEDLGELEAALMDESDLLYDEHGEPYLPEGLQTEMAGPAVEMPEETALEEEPEGDPEHSSTLITAPGTAETVAAAAAADAATAGEPEEDPLTEVNVYLAYERYDQAEELVRSAISQYPNRHEYKLRLLEVFYAAKDTTSFESSARELQAAVGEGSPLLAEAQKMWQDMSPGRDLFSEAESTVPEDQDVVFDVTDGSDTARTIPVGVDMGADEASSVDFDLGFDTAAGDDGAGGGSDSSVDFDLGFDEVGAGDAGAATEVGLDLDLTSIGEGTGIDESAGGSSLDLDLGDMGGGVAAEDDSSLDFDLTELDSSVGTAEEDAEATVPLPERAAAGDDDDLDFDLSSLGEGTLVDTQMPPEAPPGAAADSAAADDGLDFDFDNLSGGSGGLDVGGASLDTGGASLDTGVGSLDADVTALDLDLGATASDDAGTAGSRISGLDFDMGGDAEPAMGFDVGGEGDAEDLAGGGSLDEGLDFGLNLEDAGGDDADLASGLDLDMSLPGAEEPEGDLASEETVKLDLGMGADDEAGDELDTLRISPEEAAGAGDDLGIDLTLDADLGGEESAPTGIDTAFEDVFQEPGAGDAADDDAMALSMDASDLIAEPTPPPEQEGGDFPEIDMDFDSQRSGEGGEDEYEATQYMLRDMPSSEGTEGGDDDAGRTLMLGGGLTGEVDEIQTKLDLAQAYIDMGDTDGAKGILDEVIAEGNASQKQAAMGLLEKLASS